MPRGRTDAAVRVTIVASLSKEPFGRKTWNIMFAQTGGGESVPAACLVVKRQDGGNGEAPVRLPCRRR